MAAAEKEMSARRATDLISARAEVSALKDTQRELERRCEQLEVAVDEGGRQLQAAHESFRISMREALAVRANERARRVLDEPARLAR